MIEPSDTPLVIYKCAFCGGLTQRRRPCQHCESRQFYAYTRAEGLVDLRTPAKPSKRPRRLQ